MKVVKPQQRMTRTRIKGSKLLEFGGLKWPVWIRRVLVRAQEGQSSRQRLSRCRASPICRVCESVSELVCESRHPHLPTQPIGWALILAVARARRRTAGCFIWLLVTLLQRPSGPKRRSRSRCPGLRRLVERVHLHFSPCRFASALVGAAGYHAPTKRPPMSNDPKQLALPAQAPPEAEPAP